MSYNILYLCFSNSGNKNSQNVAQLLINTFFEFIFRFDNHKASEVDF